MNIIMRIMIDEGNYGYKGMNRRYFRVFKDRQTVF